MNIFNSKSFTVFLLILVVFCSVGKISYSALTFSSTTLSSSGTLNAVSTGDFTFTTTVANGDVLKLSPATGGAAAFNGIFTSSDLSANRTWTFPNVSGTVITTGDTGSVTNTMLSGSITESKFSFSDLTTGNATVSAHGFLPKLGGGTTNFLRADGTWAAPAGGGGTSVGFLAYNSVSDSSVASGTNLDFNSEVYDVTNDFANDTFTAPITGFYLLCATVQYVDAVGAGVYGPTIIVTSNRSYNIEYVSDHSFGNQALLGVSGCVIADMDAADTAVIQGDWDANVDVYGSGTPYVTHFSGRLMQ